MGRDKNRQQTQTEGQDAEAQVKAAEGDEALNAQGVQTDADSTDRGTHGEPMQTQEPDEDENLTPAQMRPENQDPGVKGPDGGDKVRLAAHGADPLEGLSEEQREAAPKGTLPGV